MKLNNKEPKIYIVCGKARHGKDTIGEIIENYYNSNNKKIIHLSYGSYIKEYAKKISNWDGNDETKPRELLQELGTEVIRKQIDELFFINRIMDDIKVYSYFFDAVVITDGRFKKEVDIPKTTFKNVVAIHVNRPNFDNGLTLEQKQHLTEIDLDDYKKYDYNIENCGTIGDLEEKVIKIIEEVE